MRTDMHDLVKSLNGADGRGRCFPFERDTRHAAGDERVPPRSGHSGWVGGRGVAVLSGG